MLHLVLLDYLCVLVSIVADLFSGLRKARQRGEKCTSAGLRRTVDKIGRYYLALFSMTVIDVLLLVSMSYLEDEGLSFIPLFPYLTTFGALSLSLIELKSICEASDEKGDFRDGVSTLLTLLRNLYLLR